MTTANFAKVSQIPIKEFNEKMRLFLQTINYRLFVQDEEYVMWNKKLSSIITGLLLDVDTPPVNPTHPAPFEEFKEQIISTKEADDVQLILLNTPITLLEIPPISTILILNC